MKVLYGGKLWEWKFGSQSLKDTFKLINPKEKVYLNGNGSGICMMVLISEIEIVSQPKKRKEEKWMECLP
ncbi:MAG: hypothetical protein WCI91_03225 [Candidatus Nomurabacteria bacterium]